MPVVSREPYRYNIVDVMEGDIVCNGHGSIDQPINVLAVLGYFFEYLVAKIAERYGPVELR